MERWSAAQVNSKIRRPGQRSKSIDERVAYALGHRIRIEILRLLIERAHTADEIADLIGESRQNVHHHLKELLDGGMIEIAKVEKKRNADLHYYRAPGTGESFDREALETMTPEERQGFAGLIVQHSTAEAIAALAAGKLSDDSRVCLMWNWFNLDTRGREELFEEQERFWKRVEEIEGESTNRRARSGEDAKPYIVAAWGYERARPPANADKRAKSF